MNDPIPMDPSLTNALPTGTRLAEFEIKDVLGVGGFGIVYRAFDHALEREVALKEYMPTSMAGRTETMQVSLRSQSNHEVFSLGLASFVNEAKLLARFDHPALLKVYRFWQANGTAYMAMPILHGQTLKDVRQSLAGPPDEAWMRALLLPLLEALEILHSQGVYHRDIAPDNIKIEADGHPVLLDFGAARRVITDKTQALTAILKPSYAPIEQYAEAGSVRQGAWTDLYSLGATMHYLLLGHPPAPATTRAVQDEQTPLALLGIAGYGTPLLGLIDWMLAPRPSDRPQSVAQVRAALLGQSPLVDSPVPTSTRDAEATQIVPRTGPAAVARTGAPAWRTTHAPHPTTTGPAAQAAAATNTGAAGTTGTAGAFDAWLPPTPAAAAPSGFSPTARHEAHNTPSQTGQLPALQPPLPTAAPAPSAATLQPPLPAASSATPHRAHEQVGKGKSVPMVAVAASVMGLVAAGGWWLMRSDPASTVPSAASAAAGGLAQGSPMGAASAATSVIPAAAAAAALAPALTSPVPAPAPAPAASPAPAPSQASTTTASGPQSTPEATAAGPRGQAPQNQPGAAKPNGKPEGARALGAASAPATSGRKPPATPAESAPAVPPPIQRGTPNEPPPARPAPAPTPSPAPAPLAAPVAPRPAAPVPLASTPVPGPIGPKATCAEVGTFKRFTCMESQCSGEARSHPDCVAWFRAHPDPSRR